ncbi:hypothetical protein LEP1GSC161_3959 [Leptospira santarosai str. CBC1416]|uniref:Uncharacterized protein n=1 Tax=Leptospira santarosai str. CBC1416 TaxID=1193059 RepID=M6VTD3_9LEPT|nr:hypothetical protein LEP1GSC161_3959 [Leptospira santarosai str. CBC1416]
MESHTGFFQETCVTREKGLEFRFRAKRFFRLLIDSFDEETKFDAHPSFEMWKASFMYFSISVI